MTVTLEKVRYTGAGPSEQWNQTRMVAEKGQEAALAHLDFLDLYKYVTRGITTLGSITNKSERDRVEFILKRWGVPRITFKISLTRYADRMNGTEAPIGTAEFSFGDPSAKNVRVFDLTETTWVSTEPVGDD